MDNMMPGDNSGAEPDEGVPCSGCDGTGKDEHGVDCEFCEGTGRVAWEPDDDEPWPALDEVS